MNLMSHREKKTNERLFLMFENDSFSSNEKSSSI